VPAFVAAGVSLLFGAWGSLFAQGDGEVVNCVPVAERASEFGCVLAPKSTGHAQSRFA
jgi:hypothetical protein